MYSPLCAHRVPSLTLPQQAIDMHVEELVGEEVPQIYTLCGKGPRSSLRILRHGLSVAPLAVSELPGSPSAVWTIKGAQADEHDAYMVVSFLNATLVLSIGEEIDEVTDSGLVGTQPTLAVALLSDDSIVQVHDTGVRRITKVGDSIRVWDWSAPGKKKIQYAAANARQVAAMLDEDELLYFELTESGEFTEPFRKQLGIEVRCGPVWGADIPHRRCHADHRH